MKRLTLAAILLAACGGKGGPPHWKDQPVEAQTAAIDGVKFSIDLPKGMEKSKVESKYSVDWQYHQGGYAFAPMLSVGHLAKKQTLDEALANEKSPPLHKDQQADGWVYAAENDSQKGKDDYIIEAQKFVGDGSLSCHARVYAMRKGEAVKDLIPLVEKMCLSLKPQP